MILNVTQHPASPEQREAGVVDAPYTLAGALTFEELPTRDEIETRAIWLADLARDEGAEAAMIGGAPYLMPALERTLRERGITPLYAFSLRESVEQTQPDGSVRKVNVFRHAGFIAAE